MSEDKKYLYDCLVGEIGRICSTDIPSEALSMWEAAASNLMELLQVSLDELGAGHMTSVCRELDVKELCTAMNVLYIYAHEHATPEMRNFVLEVRKKLHEDFLE